MVATCDLRIVRLRLLKGRYQEGYVADRCSTNLKQFNRYRTAEKRGPQDRMRWFVYSVEFSFGGFAYPVNGEHSFIETNMIANKISIQH